MSQREAIITRVSDLTARAEDRSWPWAEDNRDAIAANWQRRIAAKPRMFNGRVLLLADVLVSRGTCRSTYFETDYANLVGWLDMGYPDRSIANGFAMGALRGSDGAFICGVMADHTANAGRIYFAAGTPDRSDLRPDGTVDLAGSLTRELIEETGLHETEYVVSDEWIVVDRWPIVAMMRLVTLDVPAEEGMRLIRAKIALQKDPELQDVAIVRSADDIDPAAMPSYMQSFLRWSFRQL